MRARAEELVSQVSREELGRVIASVARLLGDLERAEEVVQDALATALERWSHEPPPQNPAAWVTTTAKNRALDVLRRARHEAAHREAAVAAPEDEVSEEDPAAHVPDERLRLVFVCCHPALPSEAQVALTLRLLGGLTTEEIARAFLVPVPTMAQRLVRAKRRVRELGLRFEVPPPEALPARLEPVLQTLYLVFNAGYAASAGARAQRVDLCDEALRLGALLVGLLPEAADGWALLALMKFHAARAPARTDEGGQPVLLEHQDRARWDRTAVVEGAAHLRRALGLGGRTRYALEAAIAGAHAAAPSWAATDWAEIAGYYEELLARWPSPVVALNHAVAVAHVQGPVAGLALMAPLEDALREYPWLHSSRGELLRRAGRPEAAGRAFEAALALAGNDADRAHLAARLRECRSGAAPDVARTDD